MKFLKSKAWYLNAELMRPNSQQFNKEAYLDLSKPYTYNWNNAQPTTKQDNACIHPINTHLTATSTKYI
jgi:hypothetical protein